ncbi:hypothetical protein SKAU_G00106270 [Synaphobranchus kaupii]|uniref:Uncharacterized protein n=1 Tax=Synaphobranchus kaupii TaxID=118154 RepID=A0A9Q1FZ90_SYNKA|nr:hypothetical protein SKAU_G00106270 [Synaphobranchus kaupii]
MSGEGLGIVINVATLAEWQSESLLTNEEVHYGGRSRPRATHVSPRPLTDAILQELPGKGASGHISCQRLSDPPWIRWAAPPRSSAQ